MDRRLQRARICERAMFGLFERLLKPTRIPERPEPPPGLAGFFWVMTCRTKLEDPQYLQMRAWRVATGDKR